VKDAITFCSAEYTPRWHQTPSTPAPRTSHPARRRSLLLFGILVVCSLVSCGKKGPPLAPLVRIPAPPADFTAERRGSDVKMQFAVPTANTDGSKPANIERIDVYGFTGPFAVNDDQLLKLGTKVASLPVKAPRDPNAADEPDEPDDPPGEPDLESEGLDQGAIAQLEDPLTQAAFQAIELPRDSHKPAAPAEADAVTGPMVGPPSSVPRRMYVAVGVNKNGRRRSFSKRLLVPLVPAPNPPSAPQISYDENAVTITWTPSTSAVQVQAPATGDLLPGRFIGLDLPTFSYHVYDVSLRAAADLGKTVTPAADVRLTNEPVREAKYEDKRMDWGATRCYTVRTVETIAGLTIQSEALPPRCETLKDTFPPAAPRDLQAVPGEGRIDLIWESNNEKDLAGYVVLRGTNPTDKLEPITPAPIQQSTFTDTVQVGVRYWYAVQAIDKAGNASPLSDRRNEAAR
jgi:predicted small lipoprotein YifL